MKIKYGSDYPAEKRAHSRALAAPQCFPLKGDGTHTRYRLIAYENGDGRALRAISREELVAARYSDWR